MLSLSWEVVDQTAATLGAKEPARRKWRQRGVPAAWRIRIAESLMDAGVPVALRDFDALETSRLAA